MCDVLSCLVSQAFQQEFEKRSGSMATVRKVAREMMEKAGDESLHQQSQLIDLTTKWERVSTLSLHRHELLDQALQDVSLSLFNYSFVINQLYVFAYICYNYI